MLTHRICNFVLIIPVVAVLLLSRAPAQDLQVFPGIDAAWKTQADVPGTNDPGAGGLYYYDADYSTSWSPGEACWVDGNGNGMFDYGTEVALFGMLYGGETGSQDGLYYADTDPANGMYDPAEDIWYDVDGNGKYDTGAQQVPVTGLFVAWWGPVAGDGVASVPFRTLEEAVGSAGPGDTIRVAMSLDRDSFAVVVDSQMYKPATSMVLPEGVVVLGGYTHDFLYRDPYLPTIIDGQGATPVFSILAYNNVIDGFIFENGSGVYISIDDYMGGAAVFSHNLFAGAAQVAVKLGQGDGFMVQNNLFTRNTTGLEIMCGNVNVFNNTFARNESGIQVGYQYNVVVTNNIIAENTATGVYEDGVFAQQMAYNTFYGNFMDVQNYDGPVVFNDIGLRASYTMNMQIDPQFVDADSGDFHLQPGSPCVDAGDPAFDVGMEPSPNGGVINLGAYGGTQYATTSGGGAAGDDPVVTMGNDTVWTVMPGDTGINPSGMGGLYYEDVDGDRAWDDGEGVWAERGGAAATYDVGTDDVVYGTPASRAGGIQDGLLFSDIPANGQYDLYEDVWYDADGDGRYTAAAMSTTADPDIYPYGGSYADPLPVTISCPDMDAVIYYTVDAGDPDSMSMLYTGAFELSAGDHTVRAVAIAPGRAPSAIVVQNYQVGTQAPVDQPFTADATTIALWHFDEGGGDTAFDRSVNGLNAYVGQQTVWYGNGKYGGGLMFGQGEQLVVNDDAGRIGLQGSMTYDLWVQSTYYEGTLLEQGTDGPVFRLSAVSNVVSVFVQDGFGKYGQLDDLYPPADGAWHHLKVVVDMERDTLSLFWDGERAAAQDIIELQPSTATGEPLYIGGNSYVPLYLDEVRITNGARYKEPLPGPTAPQNFNTASGVTGHLVPLRWDPNPVEEDIVTYVIYRDGTELTTVTGGDTYYEDGTVFPGTDYSYEIEAVNSDGASGPRAMTNVMTPDDGAMVPLSGHVYDARDSSRIGTGVYEVYAAYEDDPGYGVFTSYPDSSEDGYVIGLPGPGRYRVEVRFPLGPWIDAAFGSTVQADSMPITGIDFYVHPGDSIGGKVSYSEGNVEWMTVMAIPADKQYDVQGIRDGWYKSTETDMYGMYRIRGLAPGAYRVMVSDRSGYNAIPAADQFYNGKSYYKDADSVVLDGALRHTGINFNLVPGATVSGTLFSARDGSLVEADVYIMDTSGYVVAGGYANTYDGYRVTGIPAGTYTVYAEPNNYNYEQLVPGYYGDTESFTDARTFPCLASMMYSGINIVLPVDTVAPAVVSITPSGDSLVPVTAKITFRFSERMDVQCVEREFRLSLISDGMHGDGAPVPGTIAWQGDSVFTFRPDGGLQPGAVYRYEMRGCDLAGNELEDKKWGRFVTAATGDTEPPQVIAVSPPPAGTPPDGPLFLAVTFSELMDPATMQDAVTFSGGAVLAEYMPEMNLVLARPQVPLTDGGSYTVTVGAGARDAAGNRMTDVYTWTFTTTGLDTEPPEILYSLPNNEAIDVPATDRIQVKFDEPVDLAALDTTLVTVTMMSGNTVTLAWRMDTNDDGVLKASERLEILLDKNDVLPGAVYTVAFGSGAVRDLAGNALPAQTVSYTVRSDDYMPAVVVNHTSTEAVTDADSVVIDVEVEYRIEGGNDDVGPSGVSAATVQDLTQGSAAFSMDIFENEQRCILRRVFAPGALDPGYHLLECTVTDGDGRKTVMRERVYVFSAPPACVAPVDSVETGTAPAFLWTEAPGAAWYNLYIDDYDDMTPPEQFLLYPQVGDTARFSLPANRILAEGLYRWTVETGSDVGGDAGMAMSGMEPFRVVASAATVPAAVTGLVAGQSQYAVRLSWDPGSTTDRITGYSVGRSADDGATWTVLGNTAATTFIDSTIKYGLAYRYRVAAVNAAGTGVYTQAGPVTVAHGAPASISVTVTPNPVAKNDTAAITVAAADIKGNAWDISGDAGLKLRAVSAGDTIILSSAAITPAQEGVYVILANWNGFADAESLTVTIGTLAQIRISPATAVILHDSTLVLTAKGVYSTGDVLDVTGAVTWQTTDPAGKIVRGVYEPGGTGLFTVRATDPGGSVSDNMTVLVKRNMPPAIVLTTSFKPGGIMNSSKFSFTVTANDTDLGVSRPVATAGCRLLKDGDVVVQGLVETGTEGIWPGRDMLLPGTYVLYAAAVDADGFADTVHARVTVQTKKYQVPAAQWRMVAVPHNGSDRRTGSLFGATADVYRWNERVENDRFTLKYENLLSGATAAAARFEPGYAAWVRTDDGLLLDQSKEPYFGSSDTVVLQLEAGWNQVGNPFSYPISWSALEFEATGAGAAVLQDLPPVERVVWRYNGNEYPDDVDQDLFEPWEGYFVKANVACRAVVADPAPYFGTMVPTAPVAVRKGAAGLAAAADWALNITAVSGGSKDGYALLGRCAGAAEGRDRFDISEPMRPLDGGVRAYLVHPDAASDLAADFRPIGTGGSWILGVDAAAGDPVTLTWNPADVTAKTVLVDEARGTAVDMGAAGEYVYTADSDGSDRFTVLQGDGAAQYAEWAARGVFAVNSPNPFRHATVIRYRIPADEAGRDAVLEVFNADGVSITRMAVPAAAGSMESVSWDGPGGAGLYLYRISTGSGWHAEGLMLRSE